MPIYRRLSFTTSLLLAFGCSNTASISDMLGRWEIVDLKSSGKNVSASDRLGIEQIQLLADGTYEALAHNHRSTGTWKLYGDRLLLESPAIKDINNNEITPKRASEWFVFATEGWMHWEGTSRHGHQHLKLTLKSLTEFYRELVGTWISNDSLDHLILNENKTFTYLGDVKALEGTWSLENGSIVLISKDERGRRKSIRIEIDEDILYPRASGSNYFFIKEIK
ncbi:MAG: hypothetical protein AAGF85_18135 [Bacteroidota bacterium]